LFTTTDLSFSISSFKTIGNLERPLLRLVVVVLALVSVDSRPFETAAIFRGKTAIIWLKLTSKVGKSSARNCSAARRSLSSFKDYMQLSSSIFIWKRGNLGNIYCKTNFAKLTFFGLYFSAI